MYTNRGSCTIDWTERNANIKYHMIVAASVSLQQTLFRLKSTRMNKRKNESTEGTKKLIKQRCVIVGKNDHKEMKNTNMEVPERGCRDSALC